MALEKNRILQLSLESQLEFLKRRLQHPDAAQWRQLGKMTQDFDLWLERAKPLIPCASSLIALRVSQISGKLSPLHDSERAVRQLLELLNEAGRHLADPGTPIQVIDLEREQGALSPGPGGSTPERLIGLPLKLFELPHWLQPEDASEPFRYIIPN